MSNTLLEAAEDELERYDRLLIASESWGEGFTKDVKTHGAIIRLEASYARTLRRFFRDMADKVPRYIRIVSPVKVQADDNQFNVTVEVTGDFYDELDNEFMKISFETIALGTAIGAQAGEAIYARPLGIQSTDAIIQDLAKERLAWLVGKRIDKDGHIVPAKNDTYHISDKTRADITSTIKTSIDLGYTRQQTVEQIQNIVRNSKRAAVIAQTETVNAYSQGMLEFGRQANYPGKEWQDVSATDVCAEYAALGVVAFDYKYGGELDGPAAHVGCRCSLRLAGANEYPPQ